MNASITTLVADALPTDLAQAYEPGFGYGHPLANVVAGGSRRPANWVRAEMNEARDDDQTGAEMLDTVVSGVLRRYADFGGRPLQDPEVIGVYEWVAGRWMQAEMAERLVAAFDDRTFVPVTQKYASVTEAENNDCDLLTADGVEIQVKMWTDRVPEPEKIGDADELWAVEENHGEFGEPERVC